MTLSNRRFLVTGGMGFIGSEFVHALVAAGASVRSLDNESRGARRRLGDIAADVESIKGDIRDAQAVSRAAAGVECYAARKGQYPVQPTVAAMLAHEHESLNEEKLQEFRRRVVVAKLGVPLPEPRVVAS